MRYVFPGLTQFVEEAAQANGKPHARNRIDTIRALKDCGDLAGQAAHRTAAIGQADAGTLDVVRVVEERVNDLAIAHAAAVGILNHLRAGLGLDTAASSQPQSPPQKASKRQ